MNANKHIEEMAVELSDGGCADCADCSYANRFNCKLLYDASLLYKVGYRKKNEVIDEFTEKLKETPIKYGLPLLGLTTKGEIEEYFNCIMLQVREAIDSIANEMKGGAE